MRKSIRRYLSQHPEQSFPLFRLGVAWFFFGMVLIFIAEKHLAPSLEQELLMLAGLLITGAGFAMAMTAQLRHIMARLYRLFTR